jgi:hypothetical protein
MSTEAPRATRGTATPERSRRVVASYDSYAEAERAVDYLSDRKFPVARVAIIGRDLEYVEQVTGRLGYGGAALRGALNGAFIGFLIGWLFAVFNWVDPIVASGWLILDGLWFGTVAGTIFGLVSHALTRGRRDFDSISLMQAQRYELLVDDEVADEAARLLAEQTEPQASSAVPSGVERNDPATV